jgi:chromosome segregation ATPase
LSIIQTKSFKPNGLPQYPTKQCAVQVKQLQAEASRMEGDAAGLSRSIATTSAAIARNPVKQQALTLQTAITRLEADRSREQEDYDRLANPGASADALTGRMQRDRNELEALKTQAQDLQSHIKASEASVASLRGLDSTDKCVSQTLS